MVGTLGDEADRGDCSAIASSTDEVAELIPRNSSVETNMRADVFKDP